MVTASVKQGKSRILILRHRSLCREAVSGVSSVNTLLDIWKLPGPVRAHHGFTQSYRLHTHGRLRLTSKSPAGVLADREITEGESGRLDCSRSRWFTVRQDAIQLCARHPPVRPRLGKVEGVARSLKRAVFELRSCSRRQ